MEYIEGRTLRDLLESYEGQPVPTGEAIRIMICNLSDALTVLP